MVNDIWREHNYEYNFWTSNTILNLLFYNEHINTYFWRIQRQINDCRQQWWERVLISSMYKWKIGELLLRMITGWLLKSNFYQISLLNWFDWMNEFTKANKYKTENRISIFRFPCSNKLPKLVFTFREYSNGCKISKTTKRFRLFLDSRMSWDKI